MRANMRGETRVAQRIPRGLWVRIVRDEYSGNQCVGGLDSPGHVFRFPKLLHVLRRIVRQTGITRGVPGVELHALRSFEIFDRKGEGEPQHG